MAKNIKCKRSLSTCDVQNVPKFKGFCNERKVRFECWYVSLMFYVICMSIQTLAHTFLSN